MNQQTAIKHLEHFIRVTSQDHYSAETIAKARAAVDTLKASVQAEDERAAQGLTLASLCDLVLGEDAHDRSDDALVRAVGELKRRADASPQQIVTYNGAVIVGLEQRIAALESERDAAIEAAQKLPFDHPDAMQCPTWHDGCHCTVETLRDNIQRAERAEMQNFDHESAIATLEAELTQAQIDAQKLLNLIGAWEKSPKPRNASKLKIAWVRMAAKYGSEDDAT